MKYISLKLMFKILSELHKDLPFFPERIKIEKVKKLVSNSHDKTEYFIHKKNLKQALNHGLIFKKVYRVIIFNQKSRLKSHVDMNAKLRQKAENNFEKSFFKLINNAVFRKTMENVRKHRNVELVTTEKRRNYLASESNYRTTTFFTENLLAIEMRKTQTLIHEHVYLGLSILDQSKIVMYEFWYDYVKQKYDENARVCDLDTDSFFVHVQTDDNYKDIAEDIEARFDTSNFEIDRPLPKEKI